MRRSRFLPLFAAQALGALNDNLLKNAIVVLVVFRGIPGAPVLVALAGGLFILPYLMFSASAGQLADRYPKARLVVLAKAAELALMLVAAVALLEANVTLLFAVLTGLGVQATFFGPLKYGILPELLPAGRLLSGNALVEAGTFLAILLGTIAGGLLIGMRNGPAMVAALGVALAVAGLLASLGLPAGRAASPGLRLDRNPFTATVRLLTSFRRRRPMWRLLPALSWFWALGVVFVAEFPVLVQHSLGGDSRLVTLLLAAFSIGIGVGSLAAGRLRRRGGAGSVLPAGVALSGFAAAFVALTGLPAAANWRTPADMLASPAGFGALLALLGTAGCGGLYSVPLYAALQRLADPAERARAVAASNVMNALFMVGASVAVALLAAAGVTPRAILAVAAVVNLVAMWQLVALEPGLGEESA